jgi:sulfur-carrier protein
VTAALRRGSCAGEAGIPYPEAKTAVVGNPMRLLYFASLRSRLGLREETVSLPPEIADVAGLLDWLRGRGPAYAEALHDRAGVKVAVNQSYARPDQRITPGDEVALFPPVTGG